jgi:adhesin/invasin
MAFSLMLSLATTANANAIAGGGYSSSYSGESVFTNQPAGGSGQFSAIFFNDGTQTWAPGVIGLLICAADKTTCNVTSPNAAYASGWFSSTVYATVSATVPPGSNGFFIYNFVVPTGTAAGTVATFNGDVGLIATGLETRPQGYFQINTTPSGTGGLTISPSSASMPVGGTQQFTATGAPTGSTVNWSVTGGCGAITSAGLFAATATNSATQPCNVVATAGGLTGSVPVTVFGPASQIACTAVPTAATANGSNTIVYTATLKDANGNTVSNASSPALQFANVTPTLQTPVGNQTVTPTSGAASITLTTTTVAGNAQVSVSGGTLTGCNVIVPTTAPGSATKTTASLNRNPIAADGVSTSVLTISVTDANGNTVISDQTDVITATRDSSGSNVCKFTAVLTGTGSSVSDGSATATVVSGQVAFTLTAQTTPGTCLVAVTTNNSAVAGTSTTLTTQLTGAPNKLLINSNDTPHPAANPLAVTCSKAGFAAGTNTDPSCTIVRVTVNDVNGNRVTGATGASAITITAALDANTCTGAGGGSAVSVNPTDATSSGRSTFAFSSQGAYSACSVTFSAMAGTPPSALTSVTTTMTWTAGGADHLNCSFSPRTIVSDGSSTSAGTVRVRDVNGNTVTTGNYSISFSGTSTATTQVTSSPQTSSNGSAVFTVKSIALANGTDTYTPSITSGSSPTLPLVAPNTTCQITAQPTVP